jgi:hypothetical protein
MHLLNEYSRSLHTMPSEALNRVEARGQRLLSSLQQLMTIDALQRIEAVDSVEGKIRRPARLRNLRNQLAFPDINILVDARRGGSGFHARQGEEGLV